MGWKRSEDRVYDAVVNGVRLHCREVGDRDAPPILLLHGIMGHRHDWDVVIEVLARTHRVVVPDQRGHGRSGWTPHYSVAAMADDAEALLEHLGLTDGVAIVGHSLGAMVGMVVAARRPRLVSRLVIADVTPASLDSNFGRQLPDMLRAMGQSSYGSVEEATDEWAEGNPLVRRDLLHNYVTHALVAGEDGRLRWGFDAHGLAQLAATGIPSDQLWEAVDLIESPSLVLNGEYSSLVTRAEAHGLAARLPSCRVVVIPAGGHDLGVEQPEAVARAITDYLPQASSASWGDAGAPDLSPLEPPHVGLAGTSS